MASSRPRRTMLLLVAASALATVSALTDIPQQLHYLDGIASPVEPSPLPAHLVKRLDGLAWANLSAPLQRAVLWDAGLVRAATGDALSSSSVSSPSSASMDAHYIQVYVPCGRSMNDVLIAKQVVDRGDGAIDCAITTCNANTVSYMGSTCRVEELEAATMCAIDETQLTTLASYTHASWSQDGQIDASFDPVVARQRGFGRSETNASARVPIDLFVVLELPTIPIGDGKCPGKASFVAPCRKTNLATRDATQQWCVPEHQLGVELWINAVAADQRAASQTMTPAPSVPTTTSASSDWASNALVIALAAALTVALLLCIVLLVLLRRRKRAADRNETVLYAEIPETPAFIGGNQFQEEPPHTRPTDEYPSEGASGLSGSAARAAEFKNESYRSQSTVLAEFCGDQQLMMKRLAYGRIHFYELLDQGANGEVWRGRYDGQIVAVKRIRIGAKDSQDVEVRALETFTTEIRLASSLDHPNIVRFVGLAWRVLSDLSMVSEFMPMGDLLRFLESTAGKQMSWGDEKLSIAVDVANALVYLHSLVPPVIHRDLKSRNVLLDEQLTAKISDFGLSREHTPEETKTRGVGTMLWTAPEVLRGGKYDEKADMYSFGVLLAELDTCLLPYTLNPEVGRVKAKAMALVPLISQGEIRPKFSRECPVPILDLAAQCLDLDPAKRPPAMQVVYQLRSKIRPLL